MAIVGAGFAGLGLAWHLLSSHEVSCTVFDQEGIGTGASGVASGLLHPFPAVASHYSFMGKEAMHESLCLLNIASQYSREKIADRGGIFKLALTDADKRNYSQLSLRYERLQWWDRMQLQQELHGIKAFPALMIEQGVTVFCEEYLHALWRACAEKGGELKKQRIEAVSDLAGYDIKILCVGASIQKWDPHWKLQLIKGQILTCKAPYPLSAKSVIAQGYLAITKDPLIYHMGSSYEHHYQETAPSLETAKSLIFQKSARYIECLAELKILQCRAAVRVVSPRTHLPVIKKYGQGFYALTAFGSRGLLYHGLLAKQLAESILCRDDERISREFFLSQGYT